MGTVTPFVLKVLPEVPEGKTKLVLVKDSTGASVFEMPESLDFMQVREHFLKEEEQGYEYPFSEFLLDEYSDQVRKIKLPIWDISFDQEG